MMMSHRLYHGLSRLGNARRFMPTSYSQARRTFVSSSSDQQDDHPKNESSSSRPTSVDDKKLNPLLASITTTDSAKEVATTSLKGVGQVIFLNSQKCGGIILASLAIGDPYLAALAATGAAASTATARACQLDQSATANGLLSYNGALVGCATAVFLVPAASSVFSAVAVTASGAAATTLLSVSLSHYLNQQPQWTYSFNLVTLAMLLRHSAVQTVASSDAVEAAVVTATSSPGAVDLILGSSLTGLSQIYVVEYAGTGLGIALAIASYSPHLAGHALLGSVVGSLIGLLALGAPAADVAAGLWGYNAALTSMAVAVFCVPTRESLALSVTGAAASSLVLGSCSSLLDVPCLTLPFCLTASALYPLLLENRVPGLAVAKNPHSPERNALGNFEE